MLGFQSPSVELELAKSVRVRDIQAAEQFRLRRLVRRTRGTASAKNTGGGLSTPRPVRSATGGIGAPRRSSG
jgi:hypothetical protein